MQKTEIEQYVENYINENIRPLKIQRNRIKKLYSEINDFFGSDKCFQTGSYARHTSTRPVNDLDVFYVYGSDTEFGNIDNALSDLLKEIKEKFSSVCSENFSATLQTHSIKLQFEDDFSIDIVPAIETGTFTSDFNTPVYIVPVEKSGKWIYSDPKGYKELTKIADEKSDRKFRKSVRFIKTCRKSCKEIDDNFKLKSFHIEQILIEIFSEDDVSIIDSFNSLFSNIEEYLKRPKFKDRADDSIYIDNYVSELTPEEKDQIINWSKNKLSQVEDLLNSESITDLKKATETLLSSSKEEFKSNLNFKSLASATTMATRSFTPPRPYAE